MIQLIFEIANRSFGMVRYKQKSMIPDIATDKKLNIAVGRIVNVDKKRDFIVNKKLNAIANKVMNVNKK